MYVLGRGVPLNNVRAYMWFNISASNGNEIGVESGERIVDAMTSADISHAQAMARECMSSGYTDCR
jgi:TPR repeat protein